MRNIPGHILLCLVLMLCFRPTAAAAPQGDNYDKALDKYAVICDRCVELRARTESGQSVRTEELKVLLVELSSLRKTLSNASGKMSAAQSARFEAIKEKYMQGMRAFERKPDRPAFISIKKIPPVTEPIEVTSHGLQSESLRWLVPPVEPQAQLLKEKTRRPKEGFKLAILADAGIFPTPSYGAIVAATWRGVGVYANYQSDFRDDEYSYGCTSDGTTEYGRIWATGESRVSRSVATAGLAMWTSGHFGFYAGAGLASFIRCWEDTSGEWARVEDKSFRKFAADGGIFLTFKPVVFSLGVTSDFSGHADIRFGIGLRF